ADGGRTSLCRGVTTQERNRRTRGGSGEPGTFPAPCLNRRRARGWHVEACSCCNPAPPGGKRQLGRAFKAHLTATAGPHASRGSLQVRKVVSPSMHTPGTRCGKSTPALN